MQRKTKSVGFSSLSEPERKRIAETVERILASPAFRNSKQCQAFLQHVVGRSCTGEDEPLTERTLGIELFGRPPDYNTSDDPVVRVRASEIRKRLSQYYADSADPGDIRLEIPSGGYHVEFQRGETAPTLLAAPVMEDLPVVSAKRRPLLWLGAAALVVSLLCLAVFLLLHKATAPTELDLFWMPAIKSANPVIVHCGKSISYFLSEDVYARNRARFTDDQRVSNPLILDPDFPLHGRDIIPVTDQNVGIGTAHTAALLDGFFASRGKPIEIRYAGDLSFSDLRGAPSVLLGAFNNIWTLSMTKDLQFVFDRQGGGRRIHDRVGNRFWVVKEGTGGRNLEDYAIVSRMIASETGQPLFSAAGITGYGTRAAGELLTDASLLRQALEKAPTDWPKKDLQFLIHTNVYNGIPNRPDVIAVQVW